jgi:hypothetical protein
MIPGLISVKIVFINVVFSKNKIVFIKIVFFSQKAFFKHVHAVKRIGKEIFLLSLPSVFLLSRKAYLLQ